MRAASVVIVALLAGCSGARRLNSESAGAVEVGMTSAQVREMLGRPTEQDFDVRGEVWTWERVDFHPGCSDGGTFTKEDFWVVISRGHVVAVGDHGRFGVGEGQQCSATTRSGERCRRTTTDPNGICSVHRQ